MRTRNLFFVPALAVALAASCTAEKTQEGELPDVDVSGGALPKYDVDPAKVEITQDTQQIVTPEINVTPTEGKDP